MDTNSKQPTSESGDQPNFRTCEKCQGTQVFPKTVNDGINSRTTILAPCPKCQPKSQEPVKPDSDILPILQEADKALLANRPVVAHSCLRLAITELDC